MTKTAEKHETETCNATEIYLALKESAATPGFDSHVVASMLALSAANAQEAKIPLSEAAGCEDKALLTAMFPGMARWLEKGLRAPVQRSADEAALADLLWRGATGHDALEAELSRMMARRAQYPNHLWQDLGLNNRGELSALMSRHFSILAARNTHDMKWKKFFYRMICRDEDYTLCTAPSCSECADFENCFGDESGLSLLAKTRLRADLGK